MTNKTQHFYNNFSFFYPVVDIFLKPQKRKLSNEINFLLPGRLLEIGVGNGSHLKYYNTHQITGIDTSGAMIERAKKNKKENTELIQMDGENLHFQEEYFDYAVLSHVIAVVDNPEKMLEEVYRVLKPGGQIFILNHFTPNNWLSRFDKAFSRIALLFHFKSVFYIDSLHAIKNFKLLKEIRFGRLSYFKLLIYSKA